MNKVLAEKWIQALRSGRYKQTKSKLYSEEDGGYCCLGVLCRLKRVSKKELSEGSAYDYVKNAIGSSSHLKGIDLWALNDTGCLNNDEIITEALNFNEIADIIQAVEIERVLD